jgi:heme-degrading monooxygenase HmoA
MYVRMTLIKIKSGRMEALRSIYNEQVIPTMQKQKGVRFIHLLECLENRDEGISITAWDTKADLDAYEKSGVYEGLIEKFKDFYSTPPVLKSYEVTASSDPIILRIF